ncbi:MAG TPA: rhodanese-like domain-containing protein, partial [Thermoanaerobaculia bacterium]|nr:rhodanese-like domain-containing protein [Thermoanaerobaculia bacterium]
GMSGRPTSTLGFERVANPYLDPGLDREAFVERILGNVPPFPDYYRRMKRLNADGPPTLGHHPGGLPGLDTLPVERFSQLAADGEHLVIDLRDQLSFGGGHVPGAFGIGAGGKLSTWASWVVPYERPILLVGESHADKELRHEEIETAVRGLVRVGLDRVVGHLDGGMEAWVEAGSAIEHTPQVTARQLADKLAAGEELHVVDVREDDEWDAGHVAGAHHLPAGTLGERLDELPEGDAPLVVLCGSGYRSTVAASVLERAGRGPVWNLTGGMRAWQAAGLGVE